MDPLDPKTTPVVPMRERLSLRRKRPRTLVMSPSPSVIPESPISISHSPVPVQQSLEDRYSLPLLGEQDGIQVSWPQSPMPLTSSTTTCWNQSSSSGLPMLFPPMQPVSHLDTPSSKSSPGQQNIPLEGHSPELISPYSMGVIPFLLESLPEIPQQNMNRTQSISSELNILLSSPCTNRTLNQLLTCPTSRHNTLESLCKSLPPMESTIPSGTPSSTSSIVMDPLMDQSPSEHHSCIESISDSSEEGLLTSQPSLEGRHSYLLGNNNMGALSNRTECVSATPANETFQGSMLFRDPSESRVSKQQMRDDASPPLDFATKDQSEKELLPIVPSKRTLGKPFAMLQRQKCIGDDRDLPEIHKGKRTRMEDIGGLRGFTEYFEKDKTKRKGSQLRLSWRRSRRALDIVNYVLYILVVLITLTNSCNLDPCVNIGQMYCIFMDQVGLVRQQLSRGLFKHLQIATQT